MLNILEKIKDVLVKQSKTQVLDKQLSDLPQPEQMYNLMSMAKEVYKRLLKGERCLIAGDYDADGVMATTILKSFFNDIGFGPLVDFLIPDRFKDGYGLSPNIVEYAKDGGYNFIITVDNGIAAVKAVELANSYGITVFLTDHHTVPVDPDSGEEILPPAKFVVCPKQKNETFPFIEISGATVAWYLTAAIVKSQNLTYDMSRYLDFVGITVITDVMPLTDINLAILKYSLKKVGKKERMIYRLILKDYSVDEVSYGFSLGPMLNAAGRIDNANFLVDLFISRDQAEIVKLHQKMFELNEKRKLISHEQTQLAMTMVSEDDKIIVVKGNFHEGVVGIIAGRLAEVFKKPAIVLSWNEEGQVLKGSARTFGNVHLYNTLFKIKPLFVGFGGHAGAAGMALELKNFDKIKTALNDIAKTIPAKDWESFEADPFLLPVGDITPDIVHLLESYGPFGHGNPKPRLEIHSEIQILRSMKNELHWATLAKEDGESIEAVFFNVGEKFPSLLDCDGKLKFTAEPKIVKNDYTGVESIQVYGRLIH